MTAKRTSEPRVARDTPNLAEERFHRIRQFVRTLRVWYVFRNSTSYLLCLPAIPRHF